MPLFALRRCSINSRVSPVARKSRATLVSSGAGGGVWWVSGEVCSSLCSGAAMLFRASITGDSLVKVCWLCVLQYPDLLTWVARTLTLKRRVAKPATDLAQDPDRIQANTQRPIVPMVLEARLSGADHKSESRNETQTSPQRISNELSPKSLILYRTPSI